MTIFKMTIVRHRGFHIFENFHILLLISWILHPLAIFC